MPEKANQYNPPLDPGIAWAVEVLRKGGVETFESCEGGEGHAYPEPTVRFHGDRSEGFRALAVALQHGLPVSCLRRIWTIVDGDPTGPYWELTFTKEDDLDSLVSGKWSSDHSTEGEVVRAVKFQAEGFSFRSRQEYLAGLAVEVGRLSDDDFDKLSPHARAWTVYSLCAIRRKHKIPEFYEVRT